MKRILCCVLILLLLSTTFTAEAAGYRGGRLGVISEPEALSAEDVSYYVGETRHNLSELEWVEGGHSGKALRLAGDGGYLRLSYTVTRVVGFTFSAWVNPQGGESGQRLFTVARGTANYLTVSPWMCDQSKQLNGVYLRYQFGGTGGKVVELGNPTAPDISYALPQGEWHHIAVTSDGKTLKLYIDGVRWFEDQVLNALAELQAYSLDIGTGEWGDPTINALLDDVEIYNYALNETRIRELAGRAGETVEPYLPTRPATTTAPTTAAPTTATTVPTTTAPQTLSRTVLGVPMWGVWTIIGIVTAWLLLTLAANIMHKKEENGK